jgi:hypothetical protein
MNLCVKLTERNEENYTHQMKYSINKRSIWQEHSKGKTEKSTQKKKSHLKHRNHSRVKMLSILSRRWVGFAFQGY